LFGGWLYNIVIWYVYYVNEERAGSNVTMEKTVEYNVFAAYTDVRRIGI
jgi:hypothetical protein